MDRSIYLSITIYLPTYRPIYWDIYLYPSLCIYLSIHRSIYLSIDQSIRSIDRAIDRSTDRSIDHSILSISSYLPWYLFKYRSSSPSFLFFVCLPFPKMIFQKSTEVVETLESSFFFRVVCFFAHFMVALDEGVAYTEVAAGSNPETRPLELHQPASSRTWQRYTTPESCVVCWRRTFPRRSVRCQICLKKCCTWECCIWYDGGDWDHLVCLGCWSERMLRRLPMPLTKLIAEYTCYAACEETNLETYYHEYWTNDWLVHPASTY